ncbi:MAG: SIMPL domain-containing protein [bacterium]
MLKRMLEIMMVAIVVVGAAGAYFKWMGALPVSVTQTQKMNTFDVMGEGKVVVIPDEATINLGVVEEGYNLKTVQEQINSKMTKVAKELKSIGINEKDIKTTSYSYYPDYQEKGKYRARASVSVTVRELDKVSPALDLVGTLGLDSVSGPSFGLSDELSSKTVKEARELAIEEAKAKAEELSGLAGMKLGRIVNVAEGRNNPQPYMMRDVAAVPQDAMEKTPTPVEVGSSEISVNVTLSYETL